MTVAQPQNDPVPVRSRWRSALIRLLGGGLPAPVAAPAAPHTPPEPLSLPRLTPSQLRARAHHFFGYGEELAQRGAPDLAAPFYRQAFTLLEASLGATRSADGTTGRPAAPALEQAEAGSEPRVLPSSPDTPAAAPDWAATFQRLRQELNGETAAAILEQLQALERQGVRHAELHRLAGLAHLIQQDLTLAEADFRQALAIDPQHYAALVNLSGVLLAGGDAAGAETLLVQALEQVDPDSPEAAPALANLSLAHEQAGRGIEAARLVLRVHRLQPGHIRDGRLLQAAIHLEQMGEDVEAIELLSWLRQQQPPTAQAEVLQRLAALLERRGDYREAALVYRDLLGASEASLPAPAP